MSVSDGQLVNAAVTNAAFVSKTAVTGNTVTGIVSLQNASSGGTFTNLQQEVNNKANLTDSRFPTQDEKDALAGTDGTPDSTNKYVTDSDPRIPTQDENDALVGTDGTPSTANPFVTDSDPRIPTQDENDALVGTDGLPSTANPYVTDSDPRVPTQDENDALVGTDGTPSAANPYVTDSDPRLAGTMVETTFTIANNQGAAADVTGLVYSSASTHGAYINYILRRRTDSAEKVATGKLTVRYFKDAATWDIHNEAESSLDLGVTFSITAAGQVQYTSDNLAGASYFGQLRWYSQSFGVFAS